MGVAGMGVKRSVQAISSAPIEPSEMDVFVRRFFDQSRDPAIGGVAPMVVLAHMQEAVPRRDFDMASELLDQAEQAFDLLIDRCQRLEHELNKTQEYARAHAAEQADTIEQWKRSAMRLKVQLSDAEQAIAAAKTRCDAAEARAAIAEQRATALEHASAQAAGHAALAETLSIRLHDKVVSAFGIGSRAHPVLNAMATRAAAE